MLPVTPSQPVGTDMQKSLCPSRRPLDLSLSSDNQPAAEQWEHHGKGRKTMTAPVKLHIADWSLCLPAMIRGAAVCAMAGGTRALRQAAVPVVNGSEEQPRSATSSALQRPAEGAAVTAAQPRSLFRSWRGVDGVSFTVHPWGRRHRRIGNER